MYRYFYHKAPGSARDYTSDGTEALEEYYNNGPGKDDTPQEIEVYLDKINAERDNSRHGPIYLYIA